MIQRGSQGTQVIGVDTQTITWNFNPFTGAKVIIVLWSNSAETISSVVDNGSSPTTFTRDLLHTSGSQSVYIYRGDNITVPSVGNYAVTVTASGAHNIVVNGLAYYGVAAGGPSATNTVHSGTGSSLTSGNNTPLGAGALFVAAFADGSAISETITLTTTGYFNQGTAVNGTVYTPGAFADSIAPGGPAAQGASWTLSDSVAWVALQAVYEAAAGNPLPEGSSNAGRANSVGFNLPNPASQSVQAAPPGNTQAGDWMFALLTWRQSYANYGVTVQVADDAHNDWEPAGQPTGTSSSNGITQCALWYARAVSVPITVLAAPSAFVAGFSICVFTVRGIGNGVQLIPTHSLFVNSGTALATLKAAPFGGGGDGGFGGNAVAGGDGLFPGGGGGGGASNHAGGNGGGGLVILLVAGSPQFNQYFTSTTGWICPAGITSVQVLAWGGGGGGDDGAFSGGAGGGEFASATVAVTPGRTYTITVGTGGQGAVSVSAGGQSGTSSSFPGDSVTVLAHGGAGVSGGTGAAGGTGSTNTIHFNGGNGGNGTSTAGGGGGGGGGGLTGVGQAGSASASGGVGGFGGATSYQTLFITGAGNDLHTSPLALSATTAGVQRFQWSRVDNQTFTNGSDNSSDIQFYLAYALLSEGAYATWSCSPSADMAAIIAGFVVAAPVPGQFSSSWPWVLMEVAPDSGSATATDVIPWIPVGSGATAKRLLALDVTQGKQYELAQIQAGQGVLKLDNPDAALIPPGAGVYAGINSGTPVRVRCYWPGGKGIPDRNGPPNTTPWYVAFSGFFERWPQQWDTNTFRGFTEVTVVDAWAYVQGQLQTILRVEMLQDRPYAYWTCAEAAGATSSSNIAVGNKLPLVLNTSKYGAGNATFAFGTNPSSATQQYALLGDNGTVTSTSGVPQSSQSTVAQQATNQTDRNKGFSLSCTDSNYPPFTGNGVTIAGWWDVSLPVEGYLSGTGTSALPQPISGTPGFPTSGIPNGAVIVLSGGTPPTPLSNNTYYWVVNSTSTTFGVATSKGGTPINVTVTGNGNYFYTNPWDSVLWACRSAKGNVASLLVNNTNGSLYLQTADSAGNQHNTTVSTGGQDYRNGLSLTQYTVSLTTTTYKVVVNGTSILNVSGNLPATMPANFTEFQTLGIFDSLAQTDPTPGYVGHVAIYPSQIPIQRAMTYYWAGSSGLLSDDGGGRIERLIQAASYSRARRAIQQAGFSPTPLNQQYGTDERTTSAQDISGQPAASSVNNIVANTLPSMLYVSPNGDIVYQARYYGWNRQPDWYLGEQSGYPLNKNWDFESGSVSPWTGVNGATLTASTAWSASGSWSMQIHGDGVTSNPQAQGEPIPCTPGQQYQLSSWFYSPQGCGATLYLAFFSDAAGTALIGTSVLNISTTLVAGQPVFLTSSPIPGFAGSASMRMECHINGTPPNTTLLYVDMIVVTLWPVEYPYKGDIAYDYDPTKVLNSIQYTQIDDQSVNTPISSAITLGSILQYSAQSQQGNGYLQGDINYNYDSSPGLGELANYVACTNNAPRIRIATITVDAAEHPAAWPFVLSVSPGDVVKVNRRPPTNSGFVLTTLAKVTQVQRKLSFGTSMAGSVTCLVDSAPELSALEISHPDYGVLNGAPYLFQYTSQQYASLTSNQNITLPAPTIEGDCLIVIIASNPGQVTAPPLLGGSLDNFQLSNMWGSQSTGFVAIWTDANCTGGQTTLTVQYSGISAQAIVYVMEWGGIAPGYPTDQVMNSTSSSGTFSSGSTALTAQPAELAIGCTLADSVNPIFIRSDSGWTDMPKIPTQGNYTLHVGYQVLSLQNSIAYTGSFPYLSGDDFEAETLAWTVTGGTGVLSSFCRNGQQSLQVTTSGSPTQTFIEYTAHANWVPVTVGTSYTAVVWAYSPTGWHQADCYINWYTSGFVYLSTSSGSSEPLGAWWNSLTVVGTAPATAAFATFGITATGTPPNGTIYYVDEIGFYATAGAPTSVYQSGVVTYALNNAIVGANLIPW